MSEFNQHRVEQREEIEKPYPEEAEQDLWIQEFRQKYEGVEVDNDVYSLAGRVVRVNDFGGISFVDIRDETGEIQVVLRSETTENFDEKDSILHGDFLQASGHPCVTESGEFSLDANEFSVVSKALRDPPSDSLQDMKRMRNRVGALLSPDSTYENLEKRFRMTRMIREMLQERGFREVQTPIIHPEPSGANATPFVTRAEALEQEMFLRVAPETYLKRLVAGGFERVFEVSRCFRNEDIDTTHNPEFTLLEVYQAYSDMEEMADLTESLISTLFCAINGEFTVENGGEQIDFEPPWRRITIDSAIEEELGINISETSSDELRGLLDGGDECNKGELIARVYDELVEESIQQPTIVTNFPACTTPLCKEDDEGRLRRFEAVVAGMEIANAYSERNDPIRQQEALEGDGSSSFVQEIAYGLPPTGGVGVGLDRVAMLLTEAESVKEVIPFPMVSSKSTTHQ